MKTGTARTLTIRTLLVVLLTTAALAGCSAGVPEEVPGITGQITYVAPTATPPPLASITVEGGEQPDGAVSDKAVVAVTEATRVYDAEGRELEPSALRVGQRVKVWFTGAVAESYPVQGAAGVVQVVEPEP